jgi:hypothetical protein
MRIGCYPGNSISRVEVEAVVGLCQRVVVSRIAGACYIIRYIFLTECSDTTAELIVLLDPINNATYLLHCTA